MEIKDLIIEAHENAVNHGFWEDWDCLNGEIYENCTSETQDAMGDNAISTRLMLIVGEVAEAMEALRKSDNSNFKEELADIVIRVADLCGGLDIDLETEIRKKMDKNKDRPYKHGKAF